MSPEELAAAVEVDRLEAELRCGYEAFQQACEAALVDGGGITVHWDGRIERTASPLIVWGERP